MCDIEHTQQGNRRECRVVVPGMQPSFGGFLMKSLIEILDCGCIITNEIDGEYIHLCVDGWITGICPHKER